MTKPRSILFDLGGTLVTGAHDVVKGYRAVLQRARRNPRGLTAETICEFAAGLDRDIAARKLGSLIELPAVALQSLVFGLLDLEVEGTPRELELAFYDASSTEEPVSGVREVLGRLAEQGIGLAVLSNNVFSGEAIACELEKHDLRRYFDFVASSADYGLRKPDRMLFEVALRRAKCRPDQAWYAGNSFAVDVVGASGAGMFPVWYNPGRKAAESAVAHLDISTWSELQVAVESCADSGRHTETGA